MAGALREAFFRRAVRRAIGLVSRGRPLGRVLAAASAALQHPGRSFGGVTRDARSLVRMVRAAATGGYRRLPRRSLVAVVAALLYFLDPLDAIPDFIPVVGLVDDAAVLAWVASRVRRDLDEFLAWETGEGPVIDVGPIGDQVASP
jgi:uncharacterized membrane protein YkvA (DUF1232 family)